MQISRILGAIAGAGAILLLGISSSFAVDVGITWVSSSGTDTGSCPPNNPCRTFQYAHNQITFPSGSIYALDTIADYGPLTITKGLAIYSPDESSATRAKIHAASGNAITINAGPGDTVVLVNLRLEGGNTGDNGILFNSGRALEVYGGTIVGFNAPAPNGFSIKFAPAQLSKLIVTQTYLGFSGNGTTGGAIQVHPQSGGGAQVLLARAQLLNGVFGLAIDTTGSTGGVNAVVRNSRIQNNSQDGIVLVGGAPIGLLVDDSAVFANGGNGVRAIGANVTARLSQTAVAGNGTGVAAFSGGLVQSYGNNNIVANGANGTAVKIPTD